MLRYHRDHLPLHHHHQLSHHLRSLSTLFKPQKRIAKTNHSILTIRFHHFLLYYYSLLPKLIRILHSLYIHFHTKLHLISVLPSLSLLQPPCWHQLTMGIIRIHRKPFPRVTTHRCVVLQTSSFFIRRHHITLIFSRFMTPTRAPKINGAPLSVANIQILFQIRHSFVDFFK